MAAKRHGSGVTASGQMWEAERIYWQPEERIDANIPEGKPF
jgi:hypothetical protein